MSLGESGLTGAVHGNGPFVEIGAPSALAVSEDLIAVGGDLGRPQWSGRSVSSRSDRTVGWFPVATYTSPDLRCLSFFTSVWKVNGVAIHPSGRFVAVGTGAYDGGWNFEGELLIHDPFNGSTVSVLSSVRCVESVVWADAETLSVVIAPIDDDDIDDWSKLKYESYSIRIPDWSRLGHRSIDLADWKAQAQPAPVPDRQGPRQALEELAAAQGVTWSVRRQSWAIAAGAGDEIALGLEGAIECWSPGASTPTWRTEFDGTCTQLYARSPEELTAGLWENPTETFMSRPLVAVNIDTGTGEHHVHFRPGYPAVLVARSDGHLIVRETAHGPSGGNHLKVLSPAGAVVAELDAGSYDLFNHYFDVRRAKEFLVLVGQNPKAHEDKWVSTVERTWAGRWKVKRLFPLAWTRGAHLFGGPGLWLDDSRGTAIVHAGAVHDGRGLLRGNAFVTRRRYPDGKLTWHVPLDNEVTALDEVDSHIVAVTNLGELFIIDALTGLVQRSETLAIGGHPVIPLSLAVTPEGRTWIGTLDGRAVELLLNVAAH